MEIEPPPSAQIPDEVLADLPIFPLPSAVLFPGVGLPLHVFEPRYRDLVGHVLAARRAFGVAVLKPGYEADYEGRPDVYPVMGAGFVVAHESVADGRYNLIIQGTDRVRIVREHPPAQTFRRVAAVRIADVEDARTPDLHETLRALLLHLCTANADAGPGLAQLLHAASTASRLADLVAASVLHDTADRLRALELGSVTARLEWVTRELAARSLEGFSGGDAGTAM